MSFDNLYILQSSQISTFNHSPTTSQTTLQVSPRVSIFANFALFDPPEFEKLCGEIYPEWRKPRYGDQIRPRKHPIEACLFAVMGCLTQAMTNKAMEVTVGMAASLIDIEFVRILKILDAHLDCRWGPMNDEEKLMCIGAAKSCPWIMYYIDGCDFPIELAFDRWVYKTHKDNVKKQCAIRAQVIIDSYWGYFRGIEVEPAGMYNDQGMLQKSKWNQPGKLTDDHQYVGGDSGYYSTEHINVARPFTKDEMKKNPDLKWWNKAFNYDRGLIEHNFGDVHETFFIFDYPWRRDRHLFPLTLRVCLKLLNRYWSLDGNLPPGLRRIYKKE